MDGVCSRFITKVKTLRHLGSCAAHCPQKPVWRQLLNMETDVSNGSKHRLHSAPTLFLNALRTLSRKLLSLPCCCFSAVSKSATRFCRALRAPSSLARSILFSQPFSLPSSRASSSHSHTHASIFALSLSLILSLTDSPLFSLLHMR